MFKLNLHTLKRAFSSAQGALSVLCLVFLIASCSSESVQFPVDENVGDENTETTGRSLSATLYRPSADSLSPAVVLMHGCAGVLSKHRDWAEELADWGYTALIVDSFTPRGVKRICEAENGVWARFDRFRPQDAQAALSYLKSLPEVDANRIGLMGWSYGGTTTLSLMEDSLRPDDVDFSAAVAIYPSCWQFLQHFQTREYVASNPLLIAMGEADDWTRPEQCDQLLSQVGRNSSLVSLNLYADAYHDFDNSRQPLVKLPDVRIEDEAEYGDVTIGYNRAAHRTALKDVRAFFDRNM